MINFIKRHSVDMGKKKKDEEKGESAQANEVMVEGDHEKTTVIKLTNGKGKEVSDKNESEDDPCEGLSFSVGVSESKNGKYRRTMEDVHTYVANFCERLDWGYFAVFDGHAGKASARWCGSHLHEVLQSAMLKEGDDDHNVEGESDDRDVREAIAESFAIADKQLAGQTDVGNSGCTAAVAVLRWEEVEGESEEQDQERVRMLYTGNVGDSRLVLNRGGKPLRLSYEHKGSDTGEVRRIEQAGGLVLGGRVNGVLAVTRALGDTYVKEHVIGTPYTTATQLCPQDRHLIIACDGLWDVCTDEEAVKLVEAQEAQGAQAAAQRLVQRALEGGSCDNVTVMVVALRHHG